MRKTIITLVVAVASLVPATTWADGMPPSATKSPESDAGGAGERSETTPHNEQPLADNIIMPAPAAAAPAVHQPKIVQTAFIHKLYK